VFLHSAWFECVRLFAGVASLSHTGA